MSMGVISLLLLSAIGHVPVPSDPTPDFRGKGYLGVQFSQQGDGVVITAVMPNTAARRSGLREGDVLKRINGTALGNGVEVVPLISGRRPGSQLFLEVRRGEKTIKMNIMIGTRPEEADINPTLLPDDDD